MQTARHNHKHEARISPGITPANKYRGDGLFRHDPINDHDAAGRKKDTQHATASNAASCKGIIVLTFFHLRSDTLPTVIIVAIPEELMAPKMVPSTRQARASAPGIRPIHL